jgi:hypothetical protein
MSFIFSATDARWTAYPAHSEQAIAEVSPPPTARVSDTRFANKRHLG